MCRRRDRKHQTSFHRFFTIKLKKSFCTVFGKEGSSGDKEEEEDKKMTRENAGDGLWVTTPYKHIPRIDG